MNLTGLEQFHQGKGDDKAHRSPFQASQSQVHRAEGSADKPAAQGPLLKLPSGAAAAAGVKRHRSVCRNWIDYDAPAFLSSPL